MSITERIYRWAKRRYHDHLLKTLGGVQTCPWCKQIAQEGKGQRYDPWPQNPQYTVLTCGVCEGTSLWSWELGLFWQRALSLPPVIDPAPGAPEIKEAA